LALRWCTSHRHTVTVRCCCFVNESNAVRRGFGTLPPGSATRVGFLFAIMALVYCLLTSPVGMICTRVGFHNCLALGFVIESIGYVTLVPPTSCGRWFMVRGRAASVAVSLAFRVQSPGSRVQSPGSRVQSPGSRVQSPGSRVDVTVTVHARVSSCLSFNAVCSNSSLAARELRAD
jgi:hypothetical protein